LSSHVSGPGISSYSDSLAVLGLQSGPVTFRMYGQVDNTSGQSGFYNGSMGFNGGVVATPEPGTFGLLACAGLALLARRSQRRA
jgi:hypothetical protein